MSETTTDTTETTTTDSGSGSGGYNPPATQEELNKIVQGRVGRVEAKYADYDELRAAADELAAIKSASQSKEEKLLADLEAAKQAIAERDEKLSQAELSALRSEVAREKDVPAAHLSGATTKEEMEAAADELLAWRDAQTKTVAPKRGVLRSGATSSSDTGMTVKERAAAALRGE